MVRRCSDGADFSDVWSISALDEFLVGATRRPLIRLVRDGEPVAEAEYTSRVRLGGSDFRDVVDPAAVARLFGKGVTIVAQSLHRTHGTVRHFAEELADSISHPIQANSYLTPSDAVGLAPHADRHDVFVLQVHGTKTWRIEGLAELELRPGDTAYIPSGTRHSATATDEPSLHLTIGVLRVTYRDVLARVLRRAPEVLDDPLPLRYRTSATTLDGEIERMLDDVAGHLRGVDARTVAAAERARHTPGPPRAGALAAAASIATICESTMISVGTRWRITCADDGRVDVWANGGHVTVPASCRPALELLGDARRLSVQGLVGLDLESRVVLVRRLVAAGLCTVVATGPAR